MPTYEYACKDCGHQFDIFQSFDEDSLTVCPECQGHLRKKFNSVGVVFKGSGFYHNDSRTAGSTTAAESTGTEPSSTTSGTSESGAAAPAASSSTSTSDSSTSSSAD